MSIEEIKDIKKLQQMLKSELELRKYTYKCCQEAGEELAKNSFDWDGKEKNLVIQAMELNERFEAKKQECEELKKENYELTEEVNIDRALFAEIDQLKQANDEKNELLAKLGCPTIATARMKAFTLEQQLDQLKGVIKKYEECNKYLVEENGKTYTRLEYKLLKTLTEIKDIAEKNNKTEEELFNISISKFSMGALNGRHNLASEILQKIKEVMPDEN